MLLEVKKHDYAESKPATNSPARLRNRRKWRKHISQLESKLPVQRAIEPIAESETLQCVALWRSVIIQALYDLSGDGNCSESRLLRARGYAWFSEVPAYGKANDFETVCELAGIDRKKVLKAVRLMREEGVEVTEGMNFQSVRKEFSMRRKD